MDEIKDKDIISEENQETTESSVEVQEITEEITEQKADNIAEEEAKAKTSEEENVVERKPYKRIFVGKVRSNKADKTIIVAVERQIAHPLYKKYFKSTRSFMAHDEKNDCNIGDTVKIKESRARSARKRWELVEIVERAK